MLTIEPFGQTLRAIAGMPLAKTLQAVRHSNTSCRKTCLAWFSRILQSGAGEGVVELNDDPGLGIVLDLSRIDRYRSA